MSLEDSLYPLLRYYDAAPESVKALAGRAYRALPHHWRHGSAYAHFQQEATNAESLQGDALSLYQREALKASLQAASRTPYYAKQFAEHGVDPTRFESIDDLSRYPLLTKDALRVNREDMINPRFRNKGLLYVTSGGSTGEPVGFYLQKGVSRAKELAYLEAQWNRRGYQPGDRVAMIRGGVTTTKAKGKISSHDRTRDWLVLSSYHLTQERIPEYVQALNRFRPKHLHAYPSAALLLARGMKQQGLQFEFSLTSVLCGSEKLDLESQSELEALFHAPVSHWYGHSERVVLAGQATRSNHLYFWPTYGYVEFGPLNENGHREIIGTSFHNEAMPLIRYRTGDFVRLPEHPHAELPMPEVEKVVGRDYEFLISGTGRHISLTAVNMHDDVFDQLLSVQFHQHEPGVVEFHYIAGPQWDASNLVRMQTELQRKLGDDFAISMQSVASVTLTTSGKKRWLVSSLKSDFRH